MWHYTVGFSRVIAYWDRSGFSALFACVFSILYRLPDGNSSKKRKKKKRGSAQDEIWGSSVSFFPGHTLQNYIQIIGGKKRLCTGQRKTNQLTKSCLANPTNQGERKGPRSEFLTSYPTQICPSPEAQLGTAFNTAVLLNHPSSS